jgi:hypothetical protein
MTRYANERYGRNVGFLFRFFACAVFVTSGPFLVHRFASNECNPTPYGCHPFNVSDNIHNWYSAFGHELDEVRLSAELYCKRDGVRCLSDKVELEISYLRIRATHPRVVWEISPSHGYSTLWLAAALGKNNNGGQLLSFDLNDNVSRFALAAWKSNVKWNVSIGDFRLRFKTYLNEYPTPDYLYLDSFHNADFGRFYIYEVFPSILAIKRRVHVSLHDVFNPSFWTDGTGQNLRSTARLPDWMANEEGQIVLNWLVFHPQNYCCLFSAARAMEGSSLANVSGIRRMSFTEMTPPSWRDSVRVNAENNPTIFFDILSSGIHC